MKLKYLFELRWRKRRMRVFFFGSTGLSIPSPSTHILLKGFYQTYHSLWYLSSSRMLVNPIPNNSQQHYVTKTLPWISPLGMDLDVLLFRLFLLELTVLGTRRKSVYLFFSSLEHQKNPETVVIHLINWKWKVLLTPLLILYYLISTTIVLLKLRRLKIVQNND